MDDASKLAMLKTMTGEQDEDILSTYLSIAGAKVIRAAYPFDFSQNDVPAQYDIVQVEFAAYMINKRGAEGETAHSENGVSRSYEDGDIPPSLMRQIVPFGKVPGGASQ